MGKYKFSNNSLNTLSKIDVRLQALVHSVLEKTPYDIGIPSTGGIRTSEEQNELFKKGWSKLDGFRKKSYHQSGFAVDIVLYDEHGMCYKCLDKYEKISKIFINNFKILRHAGVFPEDSYIRWGFDWNMNGIRGDKDPYEKFYDAPHFELRNVDKAILS